MYTWCSTKFQSFYVFVFIYFNVTMWEVKIASDGEGVGPPPLGLGTCPWLPHQATAYYKLTESIWNWRTS